MRFHFRTHEFEPTTFPAIVTKVHDDEMGDDLVDLTIFLPGGLLFGQRVERCDEPRIECWSWPPAE